MILRQLIDKSSSTYTYLIADHESKEAILIDPVQEQLERDLQLLTELGLTLKYTLETHLHADHITSGGMLRQKLASKTIVAAHCGADCADRFVEQHDEITIGASIKLQVRRTPGHTSGCISYILKHDQQTYAFTGDALMIRGCGRTDFQEGSAETLYQSVHSQLFSLPDDTIVYPAHNYKGVLSSTIGEEKGFNPRLKLEVTKEEFVEIMNNLKLSPPKKIAEALPANQRCGIMEVKKECTPTEIMNINSYRVIDVRQPAEFHGELGHILESELIPLSELKKQATSWQKKQPILLVCRSGFRSNVACELLKGMGFLDVTNLKGGIIAWNKEKNNV
jgi:sulfur dioxygenase